MTRKVSMKRRKQPRQKNEATGKQLKPRLTNAQRSGNRIAELERRIAVLEARDRKLGLQLAKDISLLQERTMLSWEILWGLVAALETGSVITIDDIDAGRKRVTDEWHAEDLKKAKLKVTEDQALCEKCLHVGLIEQFSDAEDGMKCPRCKSTELPFFKEEEDETDDSESDKSLPES